MISNGIAPYLQLARYNVVCKIRHKPDFSAWEDLQENVFIIFVNVHNDTKLMNPLRFQILYGT